MYFGFTFVKQFYRNHLLITGDCISISFKFFVILSFCYREYLAVSIYF